MRGSNQHDLKTTSGATSVTLSASGAQAEFSQTSVPTRVGSGGPDGKGLYNMQRNLLLKVAVTVVRSTGGTTPITTDMLAQCIASIKYYSPVFGTLIDPVTMSGAVAKNLHEYVVNGYKRSGANRIAIPGSDATYTRYFEISIPFRQKWNPWGDHFNHWTGWLDSSTLTITAANLTAPFYDYANNNLTGCSVSSIVITPVIVTVPTPEIVIPPIVQLRRYVVAAGATGPNILGMGGDFGLNGMDDGSRLIGLWQAFNSFGFSGSGASADITQVQMKWREQFQSVNPWAFFGRYLETIDTNMNLNLAAGTAVQNDENHPYGSGIVSSVTEPLGTADLQTGAYVMPLVWPEKQSLISYYQKIKGNYSVDETFSGSQSGSFNMFALELKQISDRKASELLEMIGIDPKKVDLVPKMGRKQNPKNVDPGKLWGLPRSVVAK